MPELASSILSGVEHSPWLGLGGFVTVGGGALKSVEKVQQGEIGVRFRNGRAIRPRDSRFPRLPLSGYEGDVYAVLRPGLHGKVPFTHTIVKLSAQQRTSELTDVQVESTKNTTHNVLGSVTWRVVPEKDDKGNKITTYPEDWERLVCIAAIQHVSSENGLEEPVVERTADGIRQVMQNYESPHRAKSEDVFHDLLDLRGPELMMDYGVELLKLNLRGTSFTDAEKLGGRLAAAHPWIGGVAASAEILELPRRGAAGS